MTWTNLLNEKPKKLTKKLNLHREKYPWFFTKGQKGLDEFGIGKKEEEE